ncbi:MAG: hypothetical protein J7L51_00030 [Desulfurococcales archaeon]|nr:hypothetical protein [Desulfurococcales archaeon]
MKLILGNFQNCWVVIDMDKGFSPVYLDAGDHEIEGPAFIIFQGQRTWDKSRLLKYSEPAKEGILPMDTSYWSVLALGYVPKNATVDVFMYTEADKESQKLMFPQNIPWVAEYRPHEHYTIGMLNFHPIPPYHFLLQFAAKLARVW